MKSACLRFGVDLEKQMPHALKKLAQPIIEKAAANKKAKYLLQIISSCIDEREQAGNLLNSKL